MDAYLSKPIDRQRLAAVLDVVTADPAAARAEAADAAAGATG
jgi:hypothetical protein